MSTPEFSYSSWTPGTSICLANVPWDSTYRDVVNFTDNESLDIYLKEISSDPIIVEHATVLLPGMPIRLSTPFSAAYRYNYMRVSNPAQPVAGDLPSVFYYFITDVSYVAPNTTQFTVQLDVWQTFIRRVTLGRCYIEQGHVGIANTEQLRDHGREFLTVPEGLDVGNEYTTVSQDVKFLGSAYGIDYSILIMSTADIQSSGGTVDDPHIESALGSGAERLPNGADLYLVNNINDYWALLLNMSKTPWVTENFISVTAIPSMFTAALTGSNIVVAGVTITRLDMPTWNYSTTMELGRWFRFSHPRPERYRRLHKFTTYPYMCVEITTQSGTPIVLKPECVNDDHLKVTAYAHMVPPDPRLAFVPQNYNTTSDVQPLLFQDGSVRVDAGDGLDNAVVIGNFPSFSITNNGYLSYMASNRNSIAYQYSSADWSQQKALQGNQVSYDQASAGINSMNQQNDVSMTARNQSAQLSNEMTGLHAISGLVSGAANGPAGLAMGAVSGLANTAMSVYGTNQQRDIANRAAIASTGISTGLAGYNRDTNKGLADWAAKGDYQNAIAGINAKVQDARMIPPTTSGQVGGEAFNFATGGWNLITRIKTVSPGAMATIGEYWLRYGYAINRFGTLPKGFSCMTKFTYWKLKETYIKSATCPETFKQSIRGIFEKGVTVWNDANYIGVTDTADNVPLEGISL